MTITAFPNGISSFGMPVLGSGGVMTTGNVFFVDSGAAQASDGNGGTDPNYPKATIDSAIGECTANNGDVIFAMPGHTETVTAAAGLDFDVAGVTLIGIGSGSARPTVNFTTATTADMDIDAANITIQNILFTGGIDALAGPIDINAADCKLLSIETRDVTGQATDFILADANADRLLIDGWYHRGAAGDGADSALNLIGGDDIEVRNFRIYGNFDNGAIENVTTAAVRLSIHDGYIHSDASEDLAIINVATTTGNIGPNIFVRLADNAANIDECITGADMQIFAPIQIVNADGEASFTSAEGTYNGNFTESTDA